MELSIPLEQFRSYTAAQLNRMYPDPFTVDFSANTRAFDLAMDRTANCFSHVTLAAYQKNGRPFLNHLHSDQYAVFLWFLSNSVWIEEQNENLANKLFYLNKSLHGFSCMYDTKLPNTFLLLHTVGTVLGKAEYGEYLVAAQGSTVGAQNGKYPKLGTGVALLPYSAIIGDCTIGNGVSVGIQASV